MRRHCLTGAVQDSVGMGMGGWAVFFVHYVDDVAPGLE